MFKKRETPETYHDGVLKREYLWRLEDAKQGIVEKVIDLLATQEMLSVLVEGWTDYKAEEKEIGTKKQGLHWAIRSYDGMRAEMFRYLDSHKEGDFFRYNYRDLKKYPTSHDVIKNTIILYRSGKF